MAWITGGVVVVGVALWMVMLELDYREACRAAEYSRRPAVDGDQLDRLGEWHEKA